MKKIKIFLTSIILYAIISTSAQAMCSVKLYGIDINREWTTRACPVNGNDGCYRFFTLIEGFEINMCVGDQRVIITPIA